MIDPSTRPPENAIAIVGAGLSGGVCARALREQGLDVTVFDKSRGTGGRLATRRTEDGEFDHGASYFTARDVRFREAVEAWVAAGIVAPWTGRVVRLEAGALRDTSPTERFVGTPRMTTITRHLLGDGDFRSSFLVQQLKGGPGQWTLIGRDGDSAGPFRIVVLTVPAPQAVPLLSGAADELAAAVREVRLAPCLAIMVRLTERLDVPFDGAFVEGSPLAWISRNSSKPGRATADSWVLHASATASTEHFESDPADNIARLLAAWEAALDRQIPAPQSVRQHRWKYALAENPLDVECLFDPKLGLGVGGDWCVAARIEGAFSSGTALARDILASL